MNFIDAIKSGKQFRHTSWHTKTGKAWQNPIINPTESSVILRVPIGDLLSDDWEIQAAPVTITRDEFFEAYAYAVCKIKPNATTSALMEMIAEKLGL